MEQEGGAEAPVEKRPGEQLIETFRREREGEEWGRERERLRGWMDGSMDGMMDRERAAGRWYTQSWRDAARCIEMVVVVPMTYWGPFGCHLPLNAKTASQSRSIARSVARASAKQDMMALN